MKPPLIFLHQALEENDASLKFYKGYIHYLLSSAYFNMDSLRLGATYLEKYSESLNIHEQSLEFRAEHFSTLPETMMAYFSEEKLLDIYEASKEDVWMRNDIGFVLANYYEKKGAHETSIKFWKKGLLDLNKYQNYNLYPLKEIFENYLLLNQPDSAKHYIDLYLKANKSVFDIARNQQFAELNEKYQTAQKDIEIRKQKSAKNRILFLMIILGVLGTSLVILFFSRLRNKNLLAERELELKQKEIVDLEKEKKNNIPGIIYRRTRS